MPELPILRLSIVRLVEDAGAPIAATARLGNRDRSGALKAATKDGNKKLLAVFEHVAKQHLDRGGYWEIGTGHHCAHCNRDP
jgi:hypothetical protein